MNYSTVVLYFATILATAGWTAEPEPIEASCAALTQYDLTGLPDAPSQIVSAAIVDATDGLPQYCRVEGYVAPQVSFELRLPTTDWNDKFLMQGCGGMCGWINMGACEDALDRHYAVANTNMGHTAPPFSALWARNNRSAEIDFGFRATHVVAVVSKLIIERYYGDAPRQSYFRGCSTGGRQGMVAAQRFPDDFDGIIVGAPVLRQPGVGPLHMGWLARANMDADGEPVITADKVPLIRDAVLEACDGLDGVDDGIINDPRHCPWQPSALVCGEKDQGRDCLSPDELAAVERVYAPARDSQGRRLFPGGMMKGSELEWVPRIVAPKGERPLLASPNGLVVQVLRYLSFDQDRGPDFSLNDLDFDKHPSAFGAMASINSAINPDLRPFKQRGGKIIMYHGWNDMEVPPLVSVEYYESVVALMGGRAQTEAFLRLFMLPGVAHCRRGPGADAIDYLAYLERWVEEGLPPDEMTAHHLLKEQPYLGLPRPRYPLDDELFGWTRPVFPYPDVATFTGKGDIDLGSNWQRQPAE
jgi:pimeloyl-ACP methyl ester carboxylesterase